MADVIDLSVITMGLSRISREVGEVQDLVMGVDHKVMSVEVTVGQINAELTNLKADFDAFIYKQLRANSLSQAQQEKIALTQRLEKRFGHYDVVRRTLVGVLEQNDLALVRDESILRIAEEMVTTASRYWLAPLLVSIARWIGDDPKRADVALRKAMERDDEKTSLALALICRRVKRFEASRAWLERYFGMQDPTDMQQMAIVMLDAMSSGLFGSDENSLCLEKVNDWVTELSAAPGFVERQMDQWKGVLKAKAVSPEDLLDQLEEDYPKLAEYSPTWPKLTEFFAWSLSHEEFHKWFSAIFAAAPESTARLERRIDDILFKLANDFDAEEYPDRRELRKNVLIIEHDGDVAEAMSLFEAESSAYEAKVDFSEILTNVAMGHASSTENVPISNSARKFAIALTRDWIASAYDDLTAYHRSERPRSVVMEMDNGGGRVWSGETRDGTNEAELVLSISNYADGIRAEEMERIKITPISWVVLGAGILWLVAGPFWKPFGLVGAAIFALHMWNMKQQKEAMSQKMDEFKRNCVETLRGFLAEVVDFNAQCDEYDADGEKMHEFFTSLNENEYVKNMSLKK